MLARAPTLTLAFFGGSIASSASTALVPDERFLPFAEADELDAWGGSSGVSRARVGGGSEVDVEAWGRPAFGGIGRRSRRRGERKDGEMVGERSVASP